MSFNSFYYENDERGQRQLALNKHKKTEEDLKEYIEIIRNWFETQPHLPEIPEDILIANFLFMNKFSIESTKQRLDMYYTKQSLLPDFFRNAHPDLPHMRTFFDTIYYFPLPRSTDEGHRITVFKLIDTDPDRFDATIFYAHLFNTFEVRLHEDYFAGEILIYDGEGMTLQHILKMTPTLIKKCTTILEKVFNNSLNQIHIVNYPPFAETVIKIVKQLMKQKLVERLHLHPGMDKITDYVPIEFLPRDFGGKERSLKELHETIEQLFHDPISTLVEPLFLCSGSHEKGYPVMFREHRENQRKEELWKLKVAEYKDRFDELSQLRVDETKRPTPLINDDILGFHGNFKKLNVD